MERGQWILLSASALLFVLLYWVLDTKPAGQEAINRQRMVNASATSVDFLLKDARQNMETNELSMINAMVHELESAPNDSARIDGLRKLSSQWYRYGNAALAGHYAAELAELAQTPASWSIAGTTFAICLQQAETDKIRQYCAEEAISAFEAATSLEPSEINHRINLALVYTERPPADQPMTGILQLIELNKQHPENVAVMYQLARLALQTGQTDKAIQRLETAVRLEPDNKKLICLLAEAFQQAGRSADAAPWVAKCTQNN